MILLIDNYDSFTYNLYQYLGLFEENIEVVRNDCTTIEAIVKMNPDAIVLSPGPKSPTEAGICLEVIRSFVGKKPMLGICLGHQCIGAAFGAKIGHAKQICHGKQSVIKHNGTGIFSGLGKTLKAARYHSLVIMPDTLPDCLEVTAETEDGVIMAVQHREYPIVGLQFHPESIYTAHGKRLIENFINDSKSFAERNFLSNEITRTEGSCKCHL